MPTPEDYGGCNSECRRAGKHTLRWGGCEHAAEPEPTVSMSVVYQDHDGQNSIGFDVYTVPQLADLIADAFVTPQPGSLLIPMDRAWANGIALHAAKAIVHRNDANNGEQSPRTTPDDSPTSSDTPDNSALHGVIRKAIHDADEHSCQEQDGVDYDRLTAAALAAVRPLGKFLGDVHRDTEADLSRVIDLYEQWCKAGPPPLGTSVSRWWDRRLVELRHAIVEPVDQAERDGE